jgi:hypothetical protein
MTQKVNGAAYPGVWVERKVAFVKLTFSADIAAVLAADMVLLGTATPTSAGTVGDSSFAVVESAMVQALKILETKATVLAISVYDPVAFTVDIMLGNAEGWFAPLTNGVIATAIPVIGAQAVVETAGAAGAGFAAVGTVVGVADGSFTFDMNYAQFGALPLGTGANGTLVSGPGATSGAYPMNSPTGTAGWYPASI